MSVLKEKEQSRFDKNKDNYIKLYDTESSSSIFIDKQMLQNNKEKLKEVYNNDGLRQEYYGSYIALFNGEVLDHDKNDRELMKRIDSNIEENPCYISIKLIGDKLDIQ